jgi:hypothetical protein
VKLIAKLLLQMRESFGIHRYGTHCKFVVINEISQSTLPTSKEQPWHILGTKFLPLESSLDNLQRGSLFLVMVVVVCVWTHVFHLGNLHWTSKNNHGKWINYFN